MRYEIYYSDVYGVLPFDGIDYIIGYDDMEDLKEKEEDKKEDEI